MKNTLFDIAYAIFEQSLDLLQKLCSGFLDLLNSLFLFIYNVNSSFFRAVLWLIDKDRIHHADQVVEQEEINLELSNMMQAVRIKQDALNRGMWTSKHSEGLNELANSFYGECSWSKNRIHTYLRSIVESIPGLQYESQDPFDDAEDDDNGYEISNT